MNYTFVKKYSTDFVSVSGDKAFILDLDTLNKHSVLELLSIFSINIAKNYRAHLYIKYLEKNKLNFSKLLDLEILKDYENIITAISIVYNKEKVNKGISNINWIYITRFLDKKYESLSKELKSLDSNVNLKINYDFFKIYPFFVQFKEYYLTIDLDELNKLPLSKLVSIFNINYRTIRIDCSETMSLQFNIDKITYLTSYSNIINAFAIKYKILNLNKDRLDENYKMLFEKILTSLPDNIKLLLELGEFNENWLL